MQFFPLSVRNTTTGRRSWFSHGKFTLDVSTRFENACEFSSKVLRTAHMGSAPLSISGTWCHVGKKLKTHHFPIVFTTSVTSQLIIAYSTKQRLGENFALTWKRRKNWFDYTIWDWKFCNLCYTTKNHLRNSIRSMGEIASHTVASSKVSSIEKIEDYNYASQVN